MNLPQYCLKMAKNVTVIQQLERKEECVVKTVHLIIFTLITWNNSDVVSKIPFQPSTLSQHIHLMQFCIFTMYHRSINLLLLSSFFNLTAAT